MVCKIYKLWSRSVYIAVRSIVFYSSALLSQRHIDDDCWQRQAPSSRNRSAIKPSSSSNRSASNAKCRNRTWSQNGSKTVLSWKNRTAWKWSRKINVTSCRCTSVSWTIRRRSVSRLRTSKALLSWPSKVRTLSRVHADLYNKTHLNTRGDQKLLALCLRCDVRLHQQSWRLSSCGHWKTRRSWSRMMSSLSVKSTRPTRLLRGTRATPPSHRSWNGTRSQSSWGQACEVHVYGVRFRKLEYFVSTWL